MTQASHPSLVPWIKSRGQRGFGRETYEGKSRLLPELEIFGWLRFHTALARALEPDRHPEVFEIHYMVRGHLRWWVEKEQHEFRTGHLFIIRPDELHGADEGSLPPCEHYWLRIGFPDRGALPSLTASETQQLRRAYERLMYRNFVASPEVKEFFERLLEEHRHIRSANTLLMARSMLHALLITILRDHDRHSQALKQAPLVTWQVRRAREYLETKLFQGEADWGAVAANVGLSPAGLRARFQAETGFTPHEYLLHRRIEEARLRLMKGKDDIITIAHELGFSSSQYFATAFHRQTGETPSQYRKNQSQASTRGDGARPIKRKSFAAHRGG